MCCFVWTIFSDNKIHRVITCLLYQSVYLYQGYRVPTRTLTGFGSTVPQSNPSMPTTKERDAVSPVSVGFSYQGHRESSWMGIISINLHSCLRLELVPRSGDQSRVEELDSMNGQDRWKHYTFIKSSRLLGHRGSIFEKSWGRDSYPGELQISY